MFPISVNHPPNDNSSIEFFLPVTPVPQGRPRFSVIRGKRLVYEPMESKRIKQAIKFLAMQELSLKRLDLRSCRLPCKLEVLFVLQRPHSREGAFLPNVKPDIDNLCKLLLDALTGVLFPNDGVVCSLIAHKLYTSAEHPNVGIYVRYTQL